MDQGETASILEQEGLREHLRIMLGEFVERGEARDPLNKAKLVMAGQEVYVVRFFAAKAKEKFDGGDPDLAGALLAEGRKCLDAMEFKKSRLSEYVEGCVELAEACIQVGVRYAAQSNLRQIEGLMDDKSKLDFSTRIECGIRIARIKELMGDQVGAGAGYEKYSKIATDSFSEGRLVVLGLLAAEQYDRVKKIGLAGEIRKDVWLDVLLKELEAGHEKVLECVPVATDIPKDVLFVVHLLAKRGSSNVESWVLKYQAAGGELDDRFYSDLATDFARGGCVRQMYEALGRVNEIDVGGLNMVVAELVDRGLIDDVEKVIEKWGAKGGVATCRSLVKIHGVFRALKEVGRIEEDRRVSVLEDLLVHATFNTGNGEVGKKERVIAVLGGCGNVVDSAQRLDLTIKIGKYCASNGWGEDSREQVKKRIEADINQVNDPVVRMELLLGAADVMAASGDKEWAKSMVININQRKDELGSEEKKWIITAKLASVAVKCGLGDLAEILAKEASRVPNRNTDRISGVQVAASLIAGGFDNYGEKIIWTLGGVRSSTIDVMEACVDQYEHGAMVRYLEKNARKVPGSPEALFVDFAQKLAAKGYSHQAWEIVERNDVEDAIGIKILIATAASRGDLDVVLGLLPRVGGYENEIIRGVLVNCKVNGYGTLEFLENLARRFTLDDDYVTWDLASDLIELGLGGLIVDKVVSYKNSQEAAKLVKICLARGQVDLAKKFMGGVTDFETRYLMGLEFNKLKMNDNLKEFEDRGLKLDGYWPLVSLDFKAFGEKMRRAGIVPDQRLVEALLIQEVEEEKVDELLASMPVEDRERLIERSRRMNVGRLLELYDGVLSERVVRFLRTTDLDIGRIANKWLMAGEEETMLIRLANLERMGEIEEMRPQAVKEIVRRFGILNFGRYSTERLCKQYDNRDKKGRYGIWITTLDDRNCAFGPGCSKYHIQDPTYGDVIDAVAQAVGDDVETVVVESDSRFGVARRLLTEAKARAERGDKLKASAYRVYGAHGQRTSMSYGPGDKGVISVEDFEFEVAEDEFEVGKSRAGVKIVSSSEARVRTKMIEKLKNNLYEAGSTSLTISCETGDSHGLTKAHSKAVGGISEGPEVSDYIQSIEVSRAGAAIRLEAKYYYGKTKGYRAGVGMDST